jgi:hypothetical protein
MTSPGLSADVYPALAVMLSPVPGIAVLISMTLRTLSRLQFFQMN